MANLFIGTDVTQATNDTPAQALGNGDTLLVFEEATVAALGADTVAAGSPHGITTGTGANSTVMTIHGDIYSAAASAIHAGSANQQINIGPEGSAVAASSNAIYLGTNIGGGTAIINNAGFVSGNVGISVSGTGLITNTGEVMGRFGAVNVFGSADISNLNIIASSGSDGLAVFGDGRILNSAAGQISGKTTGVFVFNGAADIENQGNILSQTIGIKIENDDGLQTHDIVNDGDVKGGVWGISVEDIEGVNTSSVNLNNTGTIAGGLSFNTGAYFGSFGTDNIVNSGLMAGAVTLNDGGDTFDSTHGRVTGDVRGGAGFDNLLGGDGVDRLFGDDDGDFLSGGGGNDRLDGGQSDDTMDGGAGNDVFYVDNTLDLAEDAVGGGVDTVFTTVDYTLAQDQEIEFLRGNIIIVGAAPASMPASAPAASIVVNGLTLTGNEFNNIIIGTDFNDVLNGQGGYDQLRGGLGTDQMDGGDGDDWFFVDDAGDIVREGAGEGHDRVFASTSYTLTTGSEVEVLSTDNNVGTTAINLKGNELTQTIYGNDGSNLLDSAAGDPDLLIGRFGNDSYLIRNAGDSVAELTGQGTDQVFASVSYVLKAGVSVETLSTSSSAGTGAINLTGNELAQTIIGNDGANILDSGTGANDVMIGRLGNDTYIVRNAGDSITETAGQGTDRVLAGVSYTLAAGVSVENLSTDSTPGTSDINLTGNEQIQTVVGNAGDNLLYGRLGNDLLIGGGGNDKFAFDTALNAATNLDTINDFVVGSDQVQLDNAVVFAGLANGAVPAGQFRSGAGITTPADGDDHLIYNTTNGALYYDADGTGASPTVQFATLTGAPALTTGSFLVI